MEGKFTAREEVEISSPRNQFIQKLRKKGVWGGVEGRKLKKKKKLKKDPT